MFRLFYLLLVVLNLSSFAGSYHGIRRYPCYGRNSLTDWSDMGIKPSNLIMFFTPSRPGSQRIQVSENGVVLDPHYVFSDSVFTVRDVTEKDDGEYSVLLNGVLTDVLTLVVRVECRLTKEVVLYGNAYNFLLRQTYYTLEFTPEWYSDEPALLLWNRTGNPQAIGGHRGRLVDNTWLIEHITQEHSGTYTTREENQELATRRKITVEAQRLYFYKVKGEEFTFTSEMDPGELDMIYTPSGGSEVLLMEGGRMESGWESVFGGRISTMTGSRLLRVRITDVQPSDAGHFEIKDQRGNLALVVELEMPGGDLDPDPDVLSDSSGNIYIGVGVAVGVFLLLVVCCLCVRRKHRNISRKNTSVPLTETAAAEAVSFSDDTTQPSSSAHPGSSHGPTYSAPLYPKEPGSTHHHPLAEASTASHEPGSTDSLSSDAGARFEPMGRSFPSAPPDCHVYTSDKLNFPSCSSAEPQTIVYQPLAPGPVESSPASGLPVFIHPATHF